MRLRHLARVDRGEAVGGVLAAVQTRRGTHRELSGCVPLTTGPPANIASTPGPGPESRSSRMDVAFSTVHASDTASVRRWSASLLPYASARGSQRDTFDGKLTRGMTDAVFSRARPLPGGAR